MAPTKRNTSTRTPAVVRRPVKAPKPIEMFEVVSEIDDDGYVDVLIFGEPFTIDTDVNGWLIFLAGSGASRDVVNLVRSVLKVTPERGEDIEAARRREADRFDKLIGSQRGFSVEKAIELVNSLTDVSAGNGDSEPSNA